MNPFPYKYQPPPKRSVAPEHKRFVIGLNDEGMKLLDNYRKNPGMVAFVAGVHAAQIISQHLLSVDGELFQVETQPLHHDFMSQIHPEADYLVLVWPFVPPRVWQVVGWIDLRENRVSSPVPWSEFKPFEQVPVETRKPYEEEQAL